MREVDFRYLQSALASLNSSTDLVLANGWVQAVLSHQCSPYVSRRQVRFGPALRPLGADVLLAANYRKILLVGVSAEAVENAAETIGRDGRPFEDSQLGWDGPWADWVCEPVPPTLNLLQGILRSASDYGLIDSDWLRRPLIYTAWLVPVVMEWDDLGRPVFSWPDPPSEPDPELVNQDPPWRSDSPPGDGRVASCRLGPHGPTKVEEG